MTLLGQVSPALICCMNSGHSCTLYAYLHPVNNQMSVGKQVYNSLWNTLEPAELYT